MGAAAFTVDDVARGTDGAVPRTGGAYISLTPSTKALSLRLRLG